MSFLAADFGIVRLSTITLSFKTIEVIGHERLRKLANVLLSKLEKSMIVNLILPSFLKTP